MNQPLPSSKPSHAPGTRWALPLTALTLVASLGLAACQPKPDTNTPPAAAQTEPTVGQRIDDAVARTSERAEQAREEAAQAAERAGAAVADATITASVNAKLAADKELSALRINVDTQDGRVALSGDAPTMAARERATELARSVEGVVAVDNRLTLQPKG